MGCFDYDALVEECVNGKYRLASDLKKGDVVAFSLEKPEGIVHLIRKNPGPSALYLKSSKDIKKGSRVSIKYLWSVSPRHDALLMLDDESKFTFDGNMKEGEVGIFAVNNKKKIITVSEKLLAENHYSAQADQDLQKGDKVSVLFLNGEDEHEL